MGDCVHEVKVTRVGSNWGIRVLLNGEINQEALVEDRELIPREIYLMLRMEDKCGNCSDMASASRERYNRKRRSETAWRRFLDEGKTDEEGQTVFGTN